MRRVVLIIAILAICGATAFLVIRPPSAEETRPIHRTEVSDETKSQIIAAVLSEAKPEDHAVTETRELYVYVSDAVFAGVPKEINGITIRQLTIAQYNAGFKNDYLVFKDWKESDGAVTFANIVYFSGGNTGGCRYTFVQSDGKWKEDSRKCFATAS